MLLVVGILGKIFDKRILTHILELLHRLTVQRRLPALEDVFDCESVAQDMAEADGDRRGVGKLGGLSRDEGLILLDQLLPAGAGIAANRRFFVLYERRSSDADVVAIEVRVDSFGDNGMVV